MILYITQKGNCIDRTRDCMHKVFSSGLVSLTVKQEWQYSVSGIFSVREESPGRKAAV